MYFVSISRFFSCWITNVYEWLIDSNDMIDDGSCIVENSPMGTIVRTFSTTDADTHSTNTNHVYTIESGGVNAAGTVRSTLETTDHE